MGAESASAQRTREYRQRLHASQCDTDVTDVKQICHGEIEKEIEIEIDKESEIDKEIETDKEIRDNKKEKFSPESELNNTDF